MWRHRFIHRELIFKRRILEKTRLNARMFRLRSIPGSSGLYGLINSSYATSALFRLVRASSHCRSQRGSSSQQLGPTQLGLLRPRSLGGWYSTGHQPRQPRIKDATCHFNVVPVYPIIHLCYLLTRCIVAPSGFTNCIPAPIHRLIIVTLDVINQQVGRWRWTNQ